MESTVYLNGQFLPADKATVSVMDRGFLFGDGVYEVIPAYGGHLLKWGAHMQRLQNSLDAVHIDNPLRANEWRAMLNELMRRNGGGDQAVYLQVTRGAPAQRNHAFPEDTPATVFAMSHAMPPAPGLAQEGVSAVSLADNRWLRCHIKSIALLPNVLLRQQAVAEDAAEAILLRDGWLTEGAASNVFVIKDGVVMTPPKSELLLPGITRDLVVELAVEHGLPVAVREISEDELRLADEIWLTSSTREILPVTRLDDQPVGKGRPGPAWRRMVACYQDYKQALRGKVET